jgi:hypothetical protein
MQGSQYTQRQTMSIKAADSAQNHRADLCVWGEKSEMQDSQHTQATYHQ